MEHQCSALPQNMFFVQTRKNLILISTLSVNTLNSELDTPWLHLWLKFDHLYVPNLCCKNKLSSWVNIYLFSLFVPVFSAKKTTNLLGFPIRPLLTRKLLSQGLFLSRVQCVGWTLSTQQWVILCRELTEKVSPGNFQFWASENNNLLLALSIQIVAGF